MISLDLSLRAPRAPRAELAGLIFLPRSIDKVRASLPAGRLGAYALEGFSLMMLDMLHISLADLSAVVARAANDDEVATFVLDNSTQKQRGRWNAWVCAREPRGGDRAAAIELYPWLAARPDLILALDVLAEDDVRLFAL